MPHLERIYPRNPSRFGRLVDSLRSFTLGPVSLKDRRLVELFGGAPSYAGVSVTESSALNYAAVWQAVSLIAGDVGSLPLHLYKRLKDGGKARYTDHPLHYLLHDAPNSEISAMAFRETLTAHALIWGNGYAEIERDAAGRPVAVWPLLPTQVTPFREPGSGRLRYRVQGDSGRDILFDASDMLHLAGLGWDGTCGYSVIRQARQSLGLLAAAEMFGSTFFGNGTAMGGTLSHPAKLSDAARKNLTASVNARHQGPQNAHRLMILEEGMSYAKMGVDPNDAQFLETRQFQIAEVARWFNLPLHKLREMEHSSVRANIEQEALDYYQSTLRPWLVRWEQEINRKLISSRERNIQFAEFLLEGVLRADQASRYAAYATARQWGWMSVNEIRERENLNPVPDGDMYLVPQNMAPADQMDAIIEAQIRPAPAPIATADTPDEEDEDAALAERQQFQTQIAQQAEYLGRLQAQLEAATVAHDDVRAAHEAQTAELAAMRLSLDAAAGVEARASALAEEIEDIRGRFQAFTVAADTQIRELTAVVETRAVECQDAVARALAAEESAAAAEGRAVAAESTAAAAQTAESEARAQQEEMARQIAALDAEVRARTTDRAALIAAMRTVVAETVRRLVRREAEKARSKRATPAKLLAWSDQFYDDNERQVWCDTLRPVLQLHHAIIGTVDEPAEPSPATLVDAHMAESQAQIRAVVERDEEEYQAALDATLARWETQRADRWADTLIAEEIRRGR